MSAVGHAVRMPTTLRRPRTDHPHPALVALTIGAIGVVFGDIGTSPLYAFREALTLTGSRRDRPRARSSAC